MHTIDIKTNYFIETMNRTQKKSSLTFNSFGESPIPAAPTVLTPSGEAVVPSQYRYFNRNRRNVENIIDQLQYSDNYPVFVSEKNGLVYLQVGIIGYENYPKNAAQRDENKIVYGRLWLIEPSAPTSEIVQTAALAIKKAREHELREKLSLAINQGKNRATPFNSHIDLPLMLRSTERFYKGPERFYRNPDLFFNSPERFRKTTEATTPTTPTTLDNYRDYIESVLEKLKLSQLHLSLLNIQRHLSDRYLVDLKISDNPEERIFPEFSQQIVSVFCDEHANIFLHALIEQLIQLSNRHVDEQLSFSGFKRFSHYLNGEEIAQFSFETRAFDAVPEEFNQRFSQMTCEVDSARVPEFSDGELGEKLQALIDKQLDLKGYLPKQKPTDDCS